MEYIDEVKHIATRIPWNMVSDVVIMNQRSVGSGFHQTIGTGYGTRLYTGYNTFQSTSIGDIYFLVRGLPKIMFGGIADPNGVKQLALAQMKVHR